ncbi:MAG: hypothetical protein ACT4PZ_04880 [Panacagrimonas sp.]
MSPSEVQDRVDKDIGIGIGWETEVIGGLRLSDAVCLPNVITVVDVASSGAESEVWAVAYDDPQHTEGLIVAYDPADDQFIIAEHAPAGPPYVIGRHRSIRLAIKAL